MAGRILVVEESKPVLAALRRGCEAAGFQVDEVAPGDAAASLDRSRHAVAIVRAAPGADLVVAALRQADPTLAVVALFADDEEAQGYEGALDADGALVGPLSSATAIGATCRMAARLHALARRVAVLEGARRVPGARADLEFLKRLLFIEVKRSSRYRYPIALALVAIDGWTERTAALRGRARSRLMARVLGEVSRGVRDIDVAVPFTGDRLVVLMPHTRGDGALLVSRRLCARVRDAGIDPAVTVSVGVAAHEADGTVSFAELVRRAGEALARARAAGGDRAEPAEPPRKRDRISIG